MQDNTASSDWVWDLSMDNFGIGTVWYSEYATNNHPYEITIQGVTLHTMTEVGGTAERLKEYWISDSDVRLSKDKNRQ